MSYQEFVKSDVNPNDTLGGGGCICDRRKQGDCHGPYIVVYGNEMLDPLSPHVVVGAACVDAMHEQLHEGETLSAGERSTVPAQAVPVAAPAQSESPVFDLDNEDLPNI